jgi:hypothetical protein
MLRRETPSEKRRKRIESAEWLRRWRETATSLFRNPNVTLPDPEVARLVLEHDRALQAAERAGGLPDATGVEPFVCEKHGWPDARPVWWHPRPALSECPRCKAEFDAKPVGPDVPIATPNSGLYADVKATAPRLELAWRRHEEELREAGALLPGSRDEQAALERIKQLRDEEKRTHRGLVKVYEGFPYNGTRTMYTRLRKRRRSHSSGPSWDGQIIVEA